MELSRIDCSDLGINTTILVGRQKEVIDLAEITNEQEQRLKGLSSQDEDMFESLVAMQVTNIENSGLDPKTHALCRMAALVSIDAPLASYAWQAKVALECGVTVDEMVGVLIALAPTVGMARVVAAADKLAVLYDISLEEIRKVA